MGDQMEILLVTEMTEHNWTCSAWDPRTGTQLITYKGGGSVGTHALSIIQNKFVIAANQSKPLLHIWPMNSQEQVKGVRLVIPGRATALAVSPDGCFCVAGVAEHIYIWEICSGRLLAVLSTHYQSITTIRFTDDGSHFVSAGQDGMVLVWRLSNVISLKNPKQPVNPVYTFSDHALPVSDVYVGKGGMHAYMVTASLDATCKIYDLSTGNLLLTVIFTEGLTSVTLDHLDKKVYAGSISGNIYEFNLQSPPRTKEYCLPVNDTNNRFSSHKGSVTALSISLYGETLVSGSSDQSIILWHIPSKQVIRTMAHKSAITNAVFTMAPKVLFNQDHTLNLIINNFERMMQSNENHVVEILVSDKVYEEADTIDIADATIYQQNGGNDPTEHTNEMENLRLEVQKLKSINRELFEKTLKHVLSSFNSDNNRHVCNV